jgi:hypothetical protein
MIASLLDSEQSKLSSREMTNVVEDDDDGEIEISATRTE